MPQLTTYTKDTESNILASPPTADGQIAFASDTYKFYISDGTNWRSYVASKVYGNYDLSESITLSSKPMYHIDASSINTVLNGNDSQPSDGDGVASITCKATGKKMISEFATEQPTYVSASGTPIMGETTGDARIGGLNTMQFDGTQMLAYDYDGQSSFHRSLGFTIALVLRAEVDSGNSSGWSPLCGSSFQGGGSLTLKDSVSYPYFNIRFGAGGSVNRSISAAGSTAVLDQNNPTVIIARLAANKSTYTFNFDWNVNNSQFTDLYSSNYTGTQTNLYGMMLGANSPYKTSAKRFHGEIGEFLFFDSMLNNRSVNKIGNYLATKWSLNWSDI